MNSLHASNDCNWLISIPKSGRTWLRVILGKLLCDQLGVPYRHMLRTSELSESAGLRHANFTHDGTEMLAGLPLTVLERDKTAYRNSDVLFLTRDLRDLLVSCYFQAAKRTHVFEGPISSFIRHPCFGAEKILTFYAIWHEARRVPRSFTTLTYEGMHRDITSAAAISAEWLGLAAEPDAVARAIEYASFENMRRLEETGALDSGPVMKPGNKFDPESFKTRRGKVGGYPDYLSQEDVAFIDDMEERLGNPFKGVSVE